MSPQQSIKSFKIRLILSFCTIIFMVSGLFIGFIYLDKMGDATYLSSAYINVSLFFLILIALFILINFLANRLVKDLRALNLKIKNEVKELEISLEKSNEDAENKTVYLANMSHEIRTPLTAVIGMINMLKESELDVDQRVQLEIAEYSSEHLMQLVNLIIENAKVNDGRVALNLAAMDLASDLTKLFKVFEYQAWDKRLEFEYKFIPNEDYKYLLLGDITRIQQVLINLINNAIKFTNNGKISVIVDQTVAHDEDQIVTFYVKDTGVGMRNNEVNKIFDAFNFGKSFTTQDYRGAGIGLGIANQLVKMMGGELKIESKENEGSIFYFSLQLKKTLNLKLEQPEPKHLSLNKYDKTFDVLVAEDNQMNQKVIKYLLEQQGADCTFAKNGLEAVRLFDVLDFDMVFMDIYMPEMTGYEAAKLIKQSKKYAEKNVPIIAVSASAFEEDIANAKQVGIDDFLAKPIEVEKLKALLLKYASKESLD
ncbi:response regulator [Mariniflexile ostreae]|uniref:histidine kinase n=1 Tax=Mariniflexile ostreae TaxID=1520892 RepID=A0ABV5FAV1_9FLAO